jgi:hypothetical protein
MLAWDNLVVGRVAEAFTVGNTSLTLGTGQGASVFAFLTSGKECWVRCSDSDSNPTYEILLHVTAVTGDVLTVDATPASRSNGTTLAIGDLVALDITKEALAQMLVDFLAAIPTLVGDTGSGGTKGLAPAPAAGDAAAEKFLKADGTWHVTPSGSGSYYQTVQKNGTSQTQEPILNLIEGSNVTITVVDDPTNNRTSYTIAATGGGGGGVPSYFNGAGYGDRRGLIGVTNSGIPWAGAINALVASIGINTGYFSGGAPASGSYFQVDFGQSCLIIELMWNQQDATAEGVWQWQGSADGTTFVDIGGSFALGGATQVVVTTMSGCTTYYRYYRLVWISGALSNSPYIYGLNFKILFG